MAREIFTKNLRVVTRTFLVKNSIHFAKLRNDAYISQSCAK